MRQDKWYKVFIEGVGMFLVCYPSKKKLHSYFTKRLKYDVLEINEATKEDYNNYFNIKE
jgi:hypothetical protein